MNAYPWAQNRLKLERAIEAVRLENKDFTAEDVKQYYVDVLKGALQFVDEPKKDVEVVVKKDKKSKKK